MKSDSIFKFFILFSHFLKEVDYLMAIILDISNLKSIILVYLFLPFLWRQLFDPQCPLQRGSWIQSPLLLVNHLSLHLWYHLHLLHHLSLFHSSSLWNLQTASNFMLISVKIVKNWMCSSHKILNHECCLMMDSMKEIGIFQFKGGGRSADFRLWKT